MKPKIVGILWIVWIIVMCAFAGISFGWYAITFPIAVISGNWIFKKSYVYWKQQDLAQKINKKTEKAREE